MLIVDSGMFRKQFVAYVIVTKPMDVTVERRYSDFFALRQELVRIYPGFVVPPIPSKKMGKGRDHALLQKRRIIFQQFLNDTLEHPLLRRSELITQFLSLPDAEWAKTMKLFSKRPTPKEVSEFSTVEGKAKVEVTGATETYCQQVAALAGKIKEEYRILKRYNKIIAHNFGVLAESMVRAGDSCQRLSLLYSELEGKNQARLFGCMGELHTKLGNTYKAFKESFEKTFPYLYQYLKKEAVAIEELANIKKAAGVAVNNNEKKLWKKKEELFLRKDVLKWKIVNVDVNGLLNDKPLAFAEMLPEETREAERERAVHGYYANKVEEEFKRITHKNEMLLKDYYENLPSLFILKEIELQKLWTGFFNNLKNLKLTEENMNSVKH
eukprot:TRINITY_DN7792_c0_g1_i4.p1 TRINITY_DN7792_c0_g1~~TRINITY_DN7792_c0_g1_i4.p1  ORF type:complete len:382 (-),score=116.17 TRINITY_DN7792_c0_g1_i4:83-1228(-)